jgi:hypothetical protein
MSDALLPPKAAWPRFPWRDSGWWLTAFGALAALTFYLAPRLIDLDRRGRFFVAGLLVAAPLALLLTRYAGAIGLVLWQRIWHYPRLYRMFEQRGGLSDALSEHLGSSIEHWPRYELLTIHWFRDREDVCLLIRKKGGSQPAIGSTFFLYDMDSGRPLAVSTMIEVRRDGYYARVTEHFDALWLGAIRVRDTPEQPTPPGVSVFRGPMREVTNRDGDD